jgi:AcrR family transcriptional regulator
MAKKKKVEVDVSTEEKIKIAARTVFTKKGYAATRTRDIAEEAGINLALLNYYFRSKEKLFEMIMLEKMTSFLGAIVPVFDDASMTLEQKIETITSNYIEMLNENPDIPLFILSELRTNAGSFVNKLPVDRLAQSSFFKQLHQKKPELHPTQFLMNLLGLTVFPFVMKPVLEYGGLLPEKAFQTQMNQRKILIPKWIKAMMKVV